MHGYHESSPGCGWAKFGETVTVIMQGYTIFHFSLNWTSNETWEYATEAIVGVGTGV